MGTKSSENLVSASAILDELKQNRIWKRFFPLSNFGQKIEKVTIFTGDRGNISGQSTVQAKNSEVPQDTLDH